MPNTPMFDLVTKYYGHKVLDNLKKKKRPAPTINFAAMSLFMTKMPTGRCERQRSLFIIYLPINFALVVLRQSILPVITSFSIISFSAYRWSGGWLVHQSN